MPKCDFNGVSRCNCDYHWEPEQEIGAFSKIIIFGSSNPQHGKGQGTPGKTE